MHGDEDLARADAAGEQRTYLPDLQPLPTTVRVLVRLFTEMLPPLFALAA